ncbi:MAG: putative sulfate/molybdate transporter [Oligoflexia bacterium]|nr:putative sulfate/molybdate transporter [Oligoflexia bacterium]
MEARATSPTSAADAAGRNSSEWFSNAVGAFADGAILFPLLAVLSMRSGFSGAMLLASAGLAYWASGLLFRVPMSVQPLKSIAIASVAVGASSGEVRAAGALLAAACLGLLLFDVNALARKVPDSLIHGMQLSLGVLLLLQGAAILLAAPTSASLAPASVAVAVAILAVLLLSPRLTTFPVLGIVAAAGLAWAVLSGWGAPSVMGAPTPSEALRPEMILSLALPQLALTFSNSVLGTRKVALHYFGDRGERVTVRRLLSLIGLGNLLSSAVGGLPFCHGSGGVTAHVRGGATRWEANAVIGTTLLVLAGIQQWKGGFGFRYPPELLAPLLMATGAFHMKLAAPSAKAARTLAQLASMGLVTWLTKNLLAALAVGVLFELVARARVRKGTLPA